MCGQKMCILVCISSKCCICTLGFMSSIDVHLYPTPGKVGHMLAKQMTWLVSVIFVLIMQNQPTYQALRFAGCLYRSCQPQLVIRIDDA
jgi:hypothetical protein